MRYVYVLEESGNGWSAYVPDLSGCVAAGDTREEVEQLIRKAVVLHLAGLRVDHAPMPQLGTWAGAVDVDESEIGRAQYQLQLEGNRAPKGTGQASRARSTRTGTDR